MRFKLIKLSVYWLFILIILYLLICVEIICLLVCLWLGVIFSVFVKLLKVLFGKMLIGSWRLCVIILFISLLIVLLLLRINNIFIFFV